MGENSKIEWCDHTFNPWIGCTEVSPACDHCYARDQMDTRYHRVQWGRGNDRVRTSEVNRRQPLLWDKRAKAAGRIDTVFCLSYGDIWDKEVLQHWRAETFDLIEQTPNLLWLLLSKRIGNAEKMCRATSGGTPLPTNTALGATMVNQTEWDRDFLKLKWATEGLGARFSFVSVEPMLGPINMRDDRPGWVIAGGESGRNARPIHPDWVRSLRDQCQAAEVPFFFKQWGDWIDADHWLDVIERGPSKIMYNGRPWEPTRPLNFADAAIVADVTGRAGKLQHNSDGTTMIRVGKQAAGALLDGREHKAFPA